MLFPPIPSLPTRGTRFSGDNRKLRSIIEPVWLPKASDSKASVQNIPLNTENLNPTPSVTPDTPFSVVTQISRLLIQLFTYLCENDSSLCQTFSVVTVTIGTRCHVFVWGFFGFRFPISMF